MLLHSPQVRHWDRLLRSGARPIDLFGAAGTSQIISYPFKLS